MSTSNEPLWIKVRKCIRWSDSANGCTAAVLRVVADEVVPEEVLSNQDSESSVGYGRWLQRYHTRNRLLAEAERAEAGR